MPASLPPLLLRSVRQACAHPTPCPLLAPARCACRVPQSPWMTAAAATAPTRRPSESGGLHAAFHTHAPGSLRTALVCRAPVCLICQRSPCLLFALPRSVVEDTEPTSKEGSAPDGRNTAHGELAHAKAHASCQGSAGTVFIPGPRTRLCCCAQRTSWQLCQKCANWQAVFGPLPAAQLLAAAAAWMARKQPPALLAMAPATARAPEGLAATPEMASSSAVAAAMVSLVVSCLPGSRPSCWALRPAMGGAPSECSGTRACHLPPYCCLCRCTNFLACSPALRAGNGHGSGNGNGTSAVGRFTLGGCTVLCLQGLA